jgi:hypothetical protein
MHTDPFGREHRYGPPQGWVHPPGQLSLGPDDWDALVARGVQFKPYDGPRIVCRTFGDCLSPLFNGGQEYFEVRELAPDESLVDGGLYIVEPENQEEIRQIVKDRLGRSIPGVVSIAKFLRFFGGQWILVNREGLDYLRMGTVTHEVVGFIPLTGPRAGFSSTPMTHGAAPLAAGLAGAVATASMLLTGCADGEAPHCNRQPFAADSPECSQVGLNAATTTVSASVSSVTVPSTNVGAFTTIASVTVGPFPVDVTVVVTATGLWTEPVTGFGAALAFGISTTLTGGNVVVQPTTSGQQGVLATEATFALAANTTQTYLLCGQSLPGTGISSYTVTQATLKAEVIKR